MTFNHKFSCKHFNDRKNAVEETAAWMMAKKALVTSKIRILYLYPEEDGVGDDLSWPILRDDKQLIQVSRLRYAVD